MKLLLTTDTVGGVWQYATDLARALRPHGVESILALLGPASTAEQRRSAGDLRVIETGLPLDWLADSPDQVISAGRTLAALARREQVDLIHLNAPALAGSGEFPVPVVAVAHSCLETWWEAVYGGPAPDDFRWRTELHVGGLGRADLVVTPSASFVQATRRAYGLDRLATVVHNGRAPLSLPQVAPVDVAFTAGRLWDKGKDIATLDRAAAFLAFPLQAAGPLTGPNGDAVELSHAHALGVLSERDLAGRLAARPVFVSAALYEPFGLAVLEAAQAGCALVLSDIPTFRELWGDAALFVEPRDTLGFAAAISSLIEDPISRASWGAKASERASRFTVEAMAAGMAAIYRNLLDRDVVQARAAA